MSFQPICADLCCDCFAKGQVINTSFRSPADVHRIRRSNHPEFITVSKIEAFIHGLPEEQRWFHSESEAAQLWSNISIGDTADFNQCSTQRAQPMGPYGRVDLCYTTEWMRGKWICWKSLSFDLINSLLAEKQQQLRFLADISGFSSVSPPVHNLLISYCSGFFLY